MRSEFVSLDPACAGCARWSAATALRSHGCAARVSARASAQERMRIVTTTTDLRSLTEAVGGDRVAVTSLVPPNLDPEEYQPQPQDLARAEGRAPGGAGRARFRSLVRPAAGAGRATACAARRAGLCRRLVRDRAARGARRHRRPRRRPRPRQRQSALLARSEERRDHHRQHPRSAGARRSGERAALRSQSPRVPRRVSTASCTEWEAKARAAAAACR